MVSRAITKAVLTPLAEGLAQQQWDRHALTLYLQHRLPSRISTIAKPLAAELVRAFPACAAPDVPRIVEHLRTSVSAEQLHKFAQQTGAKAAMPVQAPAFRPAPAFATCDLPELATVADLAEWLALEPAQLARFSDLIGLSARDTGPFSPHYRQHLIPKPDGSLRLLEEPKPLLKRLQRRVLQQVLNRCPPHRAAYGFCPARNAAMGAARHAGEELVVCFDLSGFFPSIGWHKVYALFRRMGYPAAVARHLAGLCTAITPAPVLASPGLAAAEALSRRHLPQGAPTSPALANLVAYGLDLRLEGVASRIGATYTRYADDLSFSGDAWISAVLLRAVPEIVRECGFALNTAKTRVQPASGRQVVTGIVVNAHLNLPRETYDELKAIIHHLARAEDPRRSDPAFLRHIEGRVAWLEQINPRKGAKLRDRLADALTAEG